ncbi:hypothetical protein DACRYDRAFT_19116 [Dacryopinax primogenitus]|uniref:Uncharacterized protein n=1 Tax=Dacryopinax primogenitus (strain DJM 731) TaxID=1858805 RepID=M5FN49_DACPD|nr:uncharacterized protein DACRYDRAFT_19116 [Dacryopinax primogenitus]EJT96825.1 hypothetical protein DACRYDRAFT_19116 [Dacryopinax primogenitus]
MALPQQDSINIDQIIGKLSKANCLALVKAILTRGSANEQWSISSNELSCADDCSELWGLVDKLQAEVEDLKSSLTELKEDQNDLRNQLVTASERLDTMEVTKSAPAPTKTSCCKCCQGSDPDLPSLLPTKKAKGQLMKEEAAVHDCLYKHLRATLLCLIGYDAHVTGAPMPRKNKDARYSPEASTGSAPFLLPDWGTSLWTEGENFTIVNQTVHLVQELNMHEDLVPAPYEEWVSHAALKDLLHTIWGKFKQQFDAEHNPSQKALRDKWALEGHLSEHCKTQYSWASMGACLQALQQGVPEDNVEQFAFKIVDESWVGEEWGWDDQLDDSLHDAWWQTMCNSGQLSSVQKHDHKCAFELRAPTFMSNNFWKICKTFILIKKEADITNPTCRGKHVITAHVDLGPAMPQLHI